MALNNVVAKFKDGTILKGKTSDFFPNKKLFHLEQQDGKTVDINIEKLKALFFVKELIGNKSHKKTYDDVIPGGGRKIQVMFSDGEVITGYSHGYSPNRSGFFVIPADTKGNNKRIFIINSATEKITFP
ncbi:MAG: hypothetical protein V3R54_02615 [Thermodesulfovibrionia bacterium]